MPIIKPISALRNKSKEISKLVHESREPVFITKNGEGDMVLMSMQEYERLTFEKVLVSKLNEAEKEYSKGERGKDAYEVIDRLRKKYKTKSSK
ncbi:MAG: type II toxin-antitoxin system Phd/YefM family antitoxin [Ignavibacteria bacterium]